MKSFRWPAIGPKNCVALDGQRRSFPAIVRRRWNGWAVPIVTPKVRAQIALHLLRLGDRRSANEVKSLPVRGGLVEINEGLTFNTVPCDRRRRGYAEK